MTLSLNKEKYFIAISALIFGVLAGYTVADEAYEGHPFFAALFNGSIYIIIYVFIFIIFDKINNLNKASATHESSDSSYTDDGELFMKWKLSSSEIKVFRMLVEGLSVSDIAKSRGSSDKTVRAQMSTIYKKSGLKNQQELIAKFQTHSEGIK